MARHWTISNVDGGPLVVRAGCRNVEPWLTVGESVKVVELDELVTWLASEGAEDATRLGPNLRSSVAAAIRAHFE